MSDCEALVVGAGPTGLVLALWLTTLGARVRIVDKTSAPATTSRALAVQARTLELYRQIGIAEAVGLSAGRTGFAELLTATAVVGRSLHPRPGARCPAVSRTTPSSAIAKRLP